MNKQKSGLERIKDLEAYAEKAYDEMYEARGPAGAGGYFSEVKEVLTEAIRLAREIGLEDEALRLEKRLDHIRKVYESQMSR
jgi:hypothetical protein